MHKVYDSITQEIKEEKHELKQKRKKSIFSSISNDDEEATTPPQVYMSNSSNTQHQDEMAPILNTFLDDEVDPEKKKQLLEKEKKKQAQQNQQKNLNWTFLSFVAFLLLGAIWGSAFLFIKVAVDEETGFPPIVVVMLRMWIGALGMTVVLLILFILYK